MICLERWPSGATRHFIIAEDGTPLRPRPIFEWTDEEVAIEAERLWNLYKPR